MEGGALLVVGLCTHRFAPRGLRLSPSLYISCLPLARPSRDVAVTVATSGRGAAKPGGPNAIPETRKALRAHQARTPGGGVQRCALFFFSSNGCGCGNSAACLGSGGSHGRQRSNNIGAFRSCLPASCNGDSAPTRPRALRRRCPCPCLCPCSSPCPQARRQQQQQ